MNGWTNYQTWAAVAWGYDELTDYQISEAANHAGDSKPYTLKLANYLRERFDSDVDVICDRLGHTIFTDLLVNSIELIDWYQVAQSIITDSAKDED